MTDQDPLDQETAVVTGSNETQYPSDHRHHDARRDENDHVHDPGGAGAHARHDGFSWRGACVRDQGDPACKHDDAYSTVFHTCHRTDGLPEPAAMTALQPLTW